DSPNIISELCKVFHNNGNFCVKFNFQHFVCTFCENEESDEIEIPCDCCGSMAVADEMATW
ncbi:hypothetical protein AB2567_21075, partial [Klebsiella michiganensis]